jgi:hypothetical protein
LTWLTSGVAFTNCGNERSEVLSNLARRFATKRSRRGTDIGGTGHTRATRNRKIGASDFVWDVSANLGYQWNNWLDLYAGFRGAGTDYKSGSFVWYVPQYGPVMGASIKLN